MPCRGKVVVLNMTGGKRHAFLKVLVALAESVDGPIAVVVPSFAAFERLVQDLSRLDQPPAKEVLRRLLPVYPQELRGREIRPEQVVHDQLQEFTWDELGAIKYATRNE